MRRLAAAGILGIVVAATVVFATTEIGTGVARPAAIRPAEVPAGDIEFAWMHTTTNGVTWERFVAGLARIPAAVPGLFVDDSRAFVESTSASPEVVITRPGDPRRVRVRWYKITNEAKVGRWVRALSKRDPAPVAFIGGGSTDRAVELAEALNATPTWRGARPLLFVTTATADRYAVGTGFERAPLISIYPGRTFRFCFTNSLIAESVVDFVWKTPDLAPESPPGETPEVPSVIWNDDPFSDDLHAQFADALGKKGACVVQQQVPFSVGRMDTANAGEAIAGRGVRDLLGRHPGRRTLLMLPTVTNPARRLLREVLIPEPRLAQRLVVATGDGIPVNALIRDASFAWPARLLNVPLVLFCHNDPTDWADPGPPGYRVERPNATEEVKHFAQIGKALAEASFATDPRPDADRLAENLRAITPRLFAPDGERAAGTGEYVVVLRPGERSATLTVHRRDEAGWKRIRETEFFYRGQE